MQHNTEKHTDATHEDIINEAKAAASLVGVDVDAPAFGDFTTALIDMMRSAADLERARIVKKLLTMNERPLAVLASGSPGFDAGKAEGFRIAAKIIEMDGAK